MDIQHWLEQYLQIVDVGYVLADSTRLPAPLEVVDILHHSNMDRVAAWLRQSVVSGNTLWHRWGNYRVTRYLTSHTPVKADLSDVDVDTLLYLTAFLTPVRVWDGHRAHSLAPWIRLHPPLYGTPSRTGPTTRLWARMGLWLRPPLREDLFLATLLGHGHMVAPQITQTQIRHPTIHHIITRYSDTIHMRLNAEY